VARDEIVRLSDGPAETVFPVWSPDGGRIVYGAVERLYFGYSGAGYDYSGLWSARVDGSALDLLFATRVNGFEEVLGWLSDTTILLDTYVPNEMLDCGHRDLRTMDVVTHEMRTLLSDRFTAPSYDPKSETLLLAVVDDPACQQELTPGIYRVDIRSGAPPLQVVEDQARGMHHLHRAGGREHGARVAVQDLRHQQREDRSQSFGGCEKAVLDSPVHRRGFTGGDQAAQRLLHQETLLLQGGLEGDKVGRGLGGGGQGSGSGRHLKPKRLARRLSPR